MKHSVKTMIVALAIVMSFVVVQNVCAETFIVEGEIESISYKPKIVLVDGTEVYGVRINYLLNQYNIDLQVVDFVTIQLYENLCFDGTIKIKACEITVGDATIALRTCP